MIAQTSSHALHPRLNIEESTIAISANSYTSTLLTFPRQLSSHHHPLVDNLGEFESKSFMAEAKLGR